jgi:hypothetical protein
MIRGSQKHVQVLIGDLKPGRWPRASFRAWSRAWDVSLSFFSTQSENPGAELVEEKCLRYQALFFSDRSLRVTPEEIANGNCPRLNTHDFSRDPLKAIKP